MLRSTRLEVDLDLVAHNFTELKRFLSETAPAGSSPPRIATVLKADAYGLGAIRVAETLLAAGAELLAVACLPEALELRRTFPDADILVMGHTPNEYLERAARKRVVTTLFEYEQAKVLSDAAKQLGIRARVHLKVDTGLNRLGLKPGSESVELVERMALLPGIVLEGAFSHLALDSAESDRRQFELFSAFLAELEARGVEFAYRHVCDSIGLARYPEYRLDLVRPGALLYGVPPMRAPLLDPYDLRLPLAFKTRISRVRRLGAGEGVGYDFSWRAPENGALLATLPVGYADGYRRCLSNKAEVLLRGRRVPVVGLVMMDQLTVDCSSVPEAREGDEVLLWGAGPGGGIDSGLPLLEVARWADTNRNELIASIGRRVPRVYTRGGRSAGEVDYLLGEGGRE